MASPPVSGKPETGKPETGKPETGNPDLILTLRVSDLAGRKPTEFDLVPTAAQLHGLAGQAGADKLRKLRFAGQLVPQGERDWKLIARLGATVVQPCVVTFAPVTTRIEEPVLRTFLAHMPSSADLEVELEDETLEPLGSEIDLVAILVEALALALPLYPRAAGAEFGAATFTEAGPQPLDDKIRPFAGLRDKIGGAGENS